jgi:probable HAF family extracellular repeat protein
LTQPLGLNDQGQVIGTYNDMAGVAHGFLYSGGLFFTIDPPGSTATVLNGINNAGTIVGFFTDAENNTIGIVVTPEPAAFLLAGAGLAVLFLRRRLRNA